MCVCVNKHQRNFNGGDIQLPLGSGDELVFTGAGCVVPLTLLGKQKMNEELKPARDVYWWCR